jgi:sigma-E factor negative regulatory protein RseC
MIRETGRVITVDCNELWVETIQQSACKTCAAEKGCGQRLIAKATGNTTAIRVLPGLCKLESIRVNDQVVIGIPEKVIVNGTFLTYFLPLITMVTAVILAGQLSNSDVVAAFGALSGLLFGGAIVRLHSHLNHNNHDIHPILLEQKVITS